MIPPEVVLGGGSSRGGAGWWFLQRWCWVVVPPGIVGSSVLGGERQGGGHSEDLRQHVAELVEHLIRDGLWTTEGDRLRVRGHHISKNTEPQKHLADAEDMGKQAHKMPAFEQL